MQSFTFPFFSIKVQQEWCRISHLVNQSLQPFFRCTQPPNSCFHLTQSISCYILWKRHCIWCNLQLFIIRKISIIFVISFLKRNSISPCPNCSVSLLLYSFFIAITKALTLGIMGPGSLLVTAERISIVSKWRFPALWLCIIASYQKLPNPTYTVWV